MAITDTCCVCRAEAAYCPCKCHHSSPVDREHVERVIAESSRDAVAAFSKLIRYDEGETWMKPHPIDSLTVEVTIARKLWDSAKGDDFFQFLDEWERLMHNHQKEIDNLTGEDYDMGYRDGRRESDDAAYIDGQKEGYDRAWREAEEKLRSITGERVTHPSTEG